MVGSRDLDDVLEWLEELASTWPAKSGNIVGGPRDQDWSAFTPTDPGLLTCLMLEVPDMTHLPRPEREIGWKVDETTTRYLAERGLAWTHVRRAKHLFRRDTWTLRQPGLDHATALAEGVRAFGMSSDMCGTDTVVLREFELSGVGGAFFVSGPEEDWRARFDRHRDPPPGPRHARCTRMFGTPSSCPGTAAPAGRTSPQSARDISVTTVHCWHAMCPTRSGSRCSPTPTSNAPTT